MNFPPNPRGINDLLLHATKSVELDWICVRILRDLVEKLTRSLSIIYQQFKLTKKVLVDWKLGNVTPIWELQACHPELSVRKVMEQITLRATTQHVKDS